MVKAISTFSYTEGHGNDAVGTGYAVQAADEVRQVVQNTQIMLYNNYVSKRGQRDARMVGRSVDNINNNGAPSTVQEDSKQ